MTNQLSNRDIGLALKLARENSGRDFAELADDCKLQVKFLNALEEGHTDYLPAHIYFRMFARLYAETLKLDADKLLGRLYPEAPQPEFAHTVASKRNTGVTVETGSTPTPSIIPMAPSRPAQEAQPAGFTPQTGAPGGSQLGMNLGEMVERHRTALTRLGAVGVVALLGFFVVKYAVLNNGVAKEADATQNSSEVANGTQAGEFTMPDFELSIRAIYKTFVTVIADGDTLFSHEIQPGEALTWQADYRFEVSVDDKNSIEMYVGGQRLKTPQINGAALNNFEVNQINYTNLLEETPAPLMNSGNGK